MNTLTADLKEPKTKFRVEGIDFLRGIVMIVMALDHTRDMIHFQAFTGDPLDLQTTTPILFFTRWITHFCAPVFVFLSGTSAYLQGRRKDKSTLSSFLIKRGIWLIIAELLIINLIVSYDVFYTNIVLQVIWAIGISMVILGLLIWLPFWCILSIGLVIVLGHNLLDFYERGASAFPGWYDFLHHFGRLSLWQNHHLLVYYPFLPWTGLMILGYCLGKLYDNPDRIKVNRTITSIGIGAITLFIVLRYLNVYGDPFPWSVQKSGLYTFLSFIKVHKYPPSLLYMCMTVGPALVFLGSFGELRSAVSKVVSVYGRVPFFYYVLHFCLAHFIATILFFSRGHSLNQGINRSGELGFNFVVPGEGYSLPVVYLIWIGIVIFLYPLCRWYGEYKRRHSYWWLSYL
jgi:uncharacterized membrane protein